MIQWTDEALADVNGVAEWLYERNPQAAGLVTEDVLNSIEVLQRFPLQGRTGRIAGTRELIVARHRYIVIYRVLADDVVILRVLHTARSWPPSDA